MTDEYEKSLIEIINNIQKQCIKDCEPYLDRLSRIQTMKSPVPIIMSVLEWESHSLNPQQKEKTE